MTTEIGLGQAGVTLMLLIQETLLLRVPSAEGFGDALLSRRPTGGDLGVM